MKPKSIKNRMPCYSALASLAVALNSTITIADESSVGQGNRVALEEVVITANKTGAQSLQDVAGSVQAISTQTLERSNVGGFEDYIKLVPGLTSVSSGTGQSQIVMRGVNSTRLGQKSPQDRALVGLYIDEMPISMPGFNPDLGIVDIERLEVLRGPQGTLYGSSAMAGTIRIITKAPSVEELTGMVSMDASTTKDGDPSYGLKFGINVPLSDKWAMQFSSYGSEKGGFIDNVEPTNAEDDYNSEETVGGRAKLAYFGDNLTATATLMYNKLEADGRPDEFLDNTTDPRLASISDELQTIKFVDDPFEQEFQAANLTLQYDFENFSVVSATSYFETSVLNVLDDSFRVSSRLPLPQSTLINDDENEAFIEEFRINSTTDSSLQWVVGAYYESNDRLLDQTQPAPGLNAFFAARGVPPCSTLNGLCFGATNDSVFDGTVDVETEQLAVFGEATYHITDELRLRLGLRWYDYESDVQIRSAGVVNGGVSTSSNKIEEDGTVPKVELSYDVSEDHMVYAIYSEGFRLGGVNSFIPNACAAELALLGTTPGAPYESDTLKNYEVGAKTSWLDNRVTANVGLYRIVYEDIQSQVTLGCDFSQRVNAGELENTGVDAEFAYLINDEWLMGFGFSYVDSEVSEALPQLNSDGDEPPYVSKFTASGSLEYSVPVWQGMGYIRSNIRYVSSSYNEFSSRSKAIELDDYTVFDLTLGYEVEEWTANLFVKNLFNETVITNIDPDRSQPGQYTRGRPRTIGINLTRMF